MGANVSSYGTGTAQLAADHCWCDHRVGRDHLIGELEVLLLMLVVLVLLSANWATYDTPNGASLVAAQRPVPELVRASVTP